MKVCYFGTYRAEYSRNRILIEGLRRNGVEVIECHATLWRSIDDRVDAVSGGWKRPLFLWRVLITYINLLRMFWPHRHDFDIMVCGYPGQFDVFLARLLCWWLRKPLVWDVFMSIYLIACERKLDTGNRLIVEMLRRIEWLACRIPDQLILDTDDYVRWFHATHDVPEERFRLIPTGADSSQFKPLPLRPRHSSPFRVLYYGSFIPNHDAPTIAEAALLLAPYTDICFELIGDGPDRARCETMAQSYRLQNVVFVGWLSQDELIARADDCDVCLGAFGQTPQSMMTVHNKIYEGLALQRPVITGDSLAVRAALQADDEVLLIARRDAQSLASAILRLYFDFDLRERIAVAGNRKFQENYTLDALGACLKGHLQQLIVKENVKKVVLPLFAPLSMQADSGAPLVSVIIPNLDSPIIGATLNALRRQTFPTDAMEVLVVGRDDDGLVQEDALVRKIELPGQPSAAVNRNRGMQAARGEIICFTDADCVPAPDWLERIVHHFADPAVAVVGGGIEFASGNYWSLSDHLSWFGAFLATSPAGRRSHLPSLNLALRRALYLQIGGFDETFPVAAGEDTEWTERLSTSGATLFFDPNVRVIHAAQRFSVGEVWRHAYRYGRYSPKTRALYTGGNHKVYWLLPRHRQLRLMLAPVFATLATLRMLYIRPNWDVLYALPGIWISKLAWCVGSVHQ